MSDPPRHLRTLNLRFSQRANGVWTATHGVWSYAMGPVEAADNPDGADWHLSIVAPAGSKDDDMYGVFPKREDAEEMASKHALKMWNRDNAPAGACPSCGVVHEKPPEDSEHKAIR